METLQVCSRRGSHESDLGSPNPNNDLTYQLFNPDHERGILQRLLELRADKFLTDVTIKVGSTEIPCHRNVLVASSPYFEAMFSVELKENVSSEITFNEISERTVHDMVDFAYTGTVEINNDNVQDLLSAASLLQYPTIVEGCCQFLKRHLHASNSLGIEQFAHLHSCSQLEEEARRFTLENFGSVLEHDEYLELDAERLIGYISDDNIDVASEESVFNSCMLWIMHEPQERGKHLTTIINEVRLTTVRLSFLQGVVAQHELVLSNPDCMTIVDDAKRFLEMSVDPKTKRRRSLQKEYMLPRPSTVAKEVMVLIGGHNKEVLQSVDMYQPSKDKWTSLPPLPENMLWYAVATIDNDIFVTGGIVNNCIVNTVWKFDADARVWVSVAPMVNARARHACSAMNRKLYVFGGTYVEGAIQALCTIECYDPEHDVWSEVGEAPCPRKLSVVLPYRDSLIEIGGTQADARVKTVDSYICCGDTVKLSGEQFILPEAIGFSRFVVLNGIFYIIWEDSRMFISLDPIKRIFRHLPHMHYAHVHSGVTVLQNKIFVTGGLVDSKPSRLVECFDPYSMQWSLLRNLPQARACHGCVTIQLC